MLGYIKKTGGRILYHHDPNKNQNESIDTSSFPGVEAVKREVPLPKKKPVFADTVNKIQGYQLKMHEEFKVDVLVHQIGESVSANASDVKKSRLI